ncbi:MAG: hypothetical protein PHU51_01975 [Candidatus Nanoarchaeia archaeon]|nr:hypothetical protein [Candidatus Nanoarchaeia archaeon]
MKQIKWCLNTKNGLELIEPNENLSIAYLKKAEDAIRAAQSLKDNLDWEVSSLYYSQYFSLYALLMKCGIKCEIHSCTLEFMNVFLNKFFTPDEFELITKSQKARNDLQYYSDKVITKEFYLRMKKESIVFLVKCKNLLNDLTQKERCAIREKLNSLK